MATSFNGGRSRSTRREPPTISKQLVNFITCGCESSAPFFCNLQSRARTQVVLVIGLYELLDNPTTQIVQDTCLIRDRNCLFFPGKIDKREEFEDTTGVIRIRISKKNRQHNGQMKKYKRTNNDLQNIHIKLKIE